MQLRQAGILTIVAGAIGLSLTTGCGNQAGGKAVEKTPAQINSSEQQRAAALAAQGAKRDPGQPGGPGSLPPGVPRGMPMGAPR